MQKCFHKLQMQIRIAVFLGVVHSDPHPVRPCYPATLCLWKTIQAWLDISGNTGTQMRGEESKGLKLLNLECNGTCAEAGRMVPLGQRSLVRFSKTLAVYGTWFCRGQSMTDCNQVNSKLILHVDILNYRKA